MNQDIPIENYNYCKAVSSVQITRGEVIFNTSINVEVVLYDAQKQFVDRVWILISGEEYSSWMNDDDLIGLVLQKLGMTPVQRVEPSGEPVVQLG